jgi:hypothetical protein
MASNREEKIVFNQPRSDDERRAAAQILVERLKYRMPVAIDAMDNAVERVFAAWPERIYVVGRGGTIAYKGDMGPFGFRPEEAEAALRSLLSSGG